MLAAVPLRGAPVSDVGRFSEIESMASRLRGLRTGALGGQGVTQSSLAAVLGVKPPSVSSWESGTAVPPAERLRDYASVFSSDRTFAGPDPRLLRPAELTPEEDGRRRRLEDELMRLRELALRRDDAPVAAPDSLGGSFWHFPDGGPIRVITNPLWPSVESLIPYSSRWHPNYIQMLHDADVDATIDLYGHLRALNPASDVQYLTADRATHDDLTGHVIVLGQVDHMVSPWSPGQYSPESTPSVIDYLIPRLELPFHVRRPENGDPEFDLEFVVTTDAHGTPTYFPPTGPSPQGQQVYRPRFRVDVEGRRLVEEGYPLLEYDVAVLVRERNQLNLERTVTIAAGIFSRGTLGAVRSLTDSKFRAQNELFLRQRFGGLDQFWMIFYVPIFRAADGMETVTPDLQRPFHLLHASA
jgi:transcriptional regulator with XRE-family HTH domain